MKQIEMKKIAKSYDKQKMVLQDIDMDIEQGEFMVLVGPSGCGKSTLLRMIAGLEEISDGILRINGEIANHKLPKDRHLSMVFQNYALYPHMTVRKNILFGLDVQKVSKKEQEKRLKETAALVGLTEYLERKPAQLSGGQRQRVALARSICSRAPICLMDEPLSNLDAKLRDSMRAEIRRIQKQLHLTMVYVTHDQVEAMTMGDRITVLDNGRIQQTGTPIELYNKPENLFVATFIGSPKMNTVVGKIYGEKLIINQSTFMNMTKRQLATLPKGEEIIIGIRPEFMKPVNQESPYAVSMKVVNLELLGSETQLVLELDEHLFTVKWQGQWHIKEGENVFVSMDPECMHFFDKHTKRNICPANHSYGRNKELREMKETIVI